MFCAVRLHERLGLELTRTAASQSGIFRPEHRNRGLGGEIKRLLLEHAFNHLGMTMIWAVVEERNVRSAQALQKQGYRNAGYVAWTRLGNTGMKGDWYFDLLVSEADLS